MTGMGGQQESRHPQGNGNGKPAPVTGHKHGSGTMLPQGHRPPSIPAHPAAHGAYVPSRQPKKTRGMWIGVVALLAILGAGFAIWRWIPSNNPPATAGSGTDSGGAPTTASTQGGGDSKSPVASLKQIGTIDAGGEVVALSLSPDGYWLAWGLGERGAGVSVQHVAGTGEPISLRPVGFTADTTCVTFLDDQTLVATMGDTVYVCSIRNRVATPLKLYQRDKQGAPLCVAAYRGAGKVRAAIGFSTGAVELADVEVLEGVGLLDGDPLRIEGHKGPVRALTFIGNGRQVASVSEDATVRVISADDGKFATAQPISSDGTGPEFGRWVALLSNSTGDAWLATTARNQALIWEPRGWTAARRLGAGVHGSTVTRLAFSRANLMATASADALAVWNLETGKEVARANNPHNRKAVGGVVFSSDGQTLFSGGADGQIRKWVASR
jgi:WD40 repeat protein